MLSEKDTNISKSSAVCGVKVCHSINKSLRQITLQAPSLTLLFQSILSEQSILKNACET